MSTPLRWSDFAAAAPAIADGGRHLLYQFGPGLGYLATLRGDGAPRLHPVCPVVAEGGVYVFVGNQTPKVHDLERDGRYALHTFAAPEVDDEFCISGIAVNAEANGVRDAVHAAYMATGSTTSNDTLFELLIDRALYAKYEARPSWPPDYQRWAAG